MSEGNSESYSPTQAGDVRGSGAGAQGLANRSRNVSASPRVRPWVAAEQKEIDESKTTINNLKKSSLKDNDVNNVNLLARLQSVKNLVDMMPDRPRPIVREPTKWMINPMISVTSTDEAVEEAVAEHEDFAMSMQLARAKQFDISEVSPPGPRPTTLSTSRLESQTPLVLPGRSSSIVEPTTPPSRMNSLSGTHFGFHQVSNATTTTGTTTSTATVSTSAPSPKSSRAVTNTTSSSTSSSSSSVISDSSCSSSTSDVSPLLSHSTSAPSLPLAITTTPPPAAPHRHSSAASQLSSSSSTTSSATTTKSTRASTTTPTTTTTSSPATTITTSTATVTASTTTTVPTPTTPKSSYITITTNSGRHSAPPPARPPPSPPPRLSHVNEEGEDRRSSARASASMASIHVLGPVGSISVPATGGLTPQEAVKALDEASGSSKHRISEQKFREVKQRIGAEMLEQKALSVEMTKPRHYGTLARQDAVVGQMLSQGLDDAALWPTWLAHHDMDPRSMAFSADGLLLAIGWGETRGLGGRGNEGHIKLYNAELGELHRFQLPKKPATVNAIAFSPDGALMAVCAGRTVSIHTLPNFEMPREIDGGEGEFLCCCFSPDGLFLAAGGTSRQLTMWSTALGSSSLSHMVLYTFPYPGAITSCKFSQDGLHVVVGLDGTDKATKRRISSGKIETTFDHPGVLCCAFSPNGSMIAEGGRKRVLILRDAATGDVVQAFAHNADILCCDFSPDGALVATGDAGGSLIVRRMATGVIEHIFLCGSEVRACAFSPDGKRLASSGPEQRQACVYWIPPARIPRAYSHKLSFENIGQLHHLAGHVSAGLGAHGQLRTTRDPMAGCDFSPDSTLVATRVKWGRHIVLYDSVRGNPIRSLSNPQVFTCLSFSPNGETIACGDCVGTLIIFDVRTGDRVNAFKQNAGIASLCFSPDGLLLGTSDREGAIQVRRLPMGGMETQMTGFCHEVPDVYAHRHSVCFAPDASLFACSIGKELFVWRVFTLVAWALEHKFMHAKHDCPTLGACTFSPDGHYLTVGAGKEVIIRSTTTWDTVHVIPCAGDRHIITHICYSPKGDFLAVGMRCLKVILDGAPRNQVVVYRTSNATFDQEFERSHEISHCAFSPNGKYLAGAGGDEGNLTVWRFFGPPITKGVHSKAYFASCVLSPDGRCVAIGGRECRVTVFTADTNEVKCTFEHTAPVACVAFHPDGHHLASGGHDKKIVFWDEEGTEIQSWSRSASVQCCAFSGNGLFLAVGGADNKLEMIRLSDGVVVHSFEHSNTVNSCAFSSDHLRLASGGDDGRLTIRRADTGETERVFTHAAPVTSICFSPDGTLIVAGDGSSKVIVRRVELSANLALLLSFTHSAPVANVYFSPDGELLVTCGEDGNLTVRPIQTGEVAYTFRGTHCCVRAPCPIAKTQLFIAFDGDLQTSRILTPHLVDPTWLQHCSPASLEWLLEMGRLDPGAHDANGASLIGRLFGEQPHLAAVIARRAPPLLLLTTLEAAVKSTGAEGETVTELVKAWAHMPISEGLPYGADGAVGVLARLVVASPETAAKLLQKVFAPTQDAAGRGELHRYIEKIQTKSHRSLQLNVWHRGVNNPNDPAVHSLVSRIPGLLDPPQKWPVIRHVAVSPQQPKTVAGTLNLGSVFHAATRLSDQPGKRQLFETVFMKQAVIHKWKRIRFFFFTMMSCYTAYVIFLYLSAAQIRTFAEERSVPDPWALQVVSILLSGIGACGQLLEMRNRWSAWNVGSLTAFCFNAAVNAYYLSFGTSLDTFNAVSTLHAFALLLASVGMFSFLKVMPGTGPKVVMVLSIMKDIRWFILLVIVVILAFGSAFVLLFPWSDEASNPVEQVLLMYRMTLGDYDIERYEFSPVVRFFFFGFTFVVVIVFLNLLIAIMGDTYDRIKETEEVENYKALARYICDVELNWEFLLHRRFCCGVRGNEYFYVLSPIADLESLGSSWEGRMQTIRRYIEEAVTKLGKDIRERDLRYDVKLDQANRRLVLMAGSDLLKKVQ